MTMKDLEKLEGLIKEMIQIERGKNVWRHTLYKELVLGKTVLFPSVYEQDFQVLLLEMEDNGYILEKEAGKEGYVGYRLRGKKDV